MREDAAGGLPAGFRAAGVAAGIKPSGGPDVGLLVCDAPETTSAARFTRSGVLAAPVLADAGALRAWTRCAPWSPTRGNANAATGGRGLDDAAQDAGRRGDGAAACRADQVAVASTGVIGVPLDARRGRQRARSRARGELRADGDADFAEAILTTDAFEKRAALEVDAARRAPCASARRPRARG